MTATPVPVSVVVAAHNEAAEIEACLASVAWADEIFVVENDSSDNTVELATGAGATVVTHDFTTIGTQRNVAIARARNRWVLVIDADERATPEFAKAVAEVVTSSNTTTAWRAPRRNFFLGREIRHGGWERDRPVRLFHRDLRYDERPVHEHVIVHGPVGTLGVPLMHTPYATLGEYFEKLHRYSRWWAEQHLARGRRASLSDLTLRPAARFFTMLIIRQGWRDGTHGVVIAVLGAMSVAAKYAQLWAMARDRHA